MDSAPVRYRNAALAQPVEHIIRNDGVECSSHSSGTIIFKGLAHEPENRKSSLNLIPLVLDQIGGLAGDQHRRRITRFQVQRLRY